MHNNLFIPVKTKELRLLQKSKNKKIKETEWVKCLATQIFTNNLCYSKPRQAQTKYYIDDFNGKDPIRTMANAEGCF